MTPPDPVIVDTNVVVASLITRDSHAPTAVIVDGMMSGRLRALLSTALLAEYRRVLLRPRVARIHQLTPAEIDTVLVGLARHATILEPNPIALPDNPGDAHIASLLRAWPDVALITGDSALAHRVSGEARSLTPTEWSRLPDAPGYQRE